MLYAQSQQDLDRDLEFFESQVRPLLVEHCYECHAESEQSGGLRLDSKQGWEAGGDSGPALLPHNPEASLLLKAIEYSAPDLQMPPSGMLVADSIRILRDWIERGAPDPRRSTIRKPESSGIDINQSRNFWAFQPLAKNPSQPVSRLSQRAWVRNPIDAFILNDLLQRNLQPAPRASKRLLIRRVTLDLTGLPPTADEVSAFLANDRPDAYESLVSRLLDSKRYGERWGRHWLDVARYSDSNGLDENLAFGNAWRYRDYVIGAFNADKPYDRFVREQLAGDLLPAANAETRAATAFLALGAKVLAEPDREKLVMDTIDEQIDTTGKVFVGLTLGCARCHDHKFDPIRQADYYGLAAIFKGTRTFADTSTGAIRHWYEHSFATEAELESLKTIDAEIQAAKKKAADFKNSQLSRVRQKALSKAASYLAAASLFDSQASLQTVQPIAEVYGLHARILHSCRLHLEHRQTGTLERYWHTLAGKVAASEIESVFERLFRECQHDQLATNTERPPQPQAYRKLLVAAKLALGDKSGFLTVPPQPEFALDSKTLASYLALMEQARKLESQAPDEAACMGVTDGEVVEHIALHIRGSHNNLGARVKRSIPAILHSGENHPDFSREQSGRLELARWLTGPVAYLTARVQTNRIWGWHFGHALVSTTENFGALGERPSHPELLDWLANQFIQSGWSSKHLHRLILLSNTYQMDSRHPRQSEMASTDPENRWLWRSPIQRMDAEQLRDSILYLAGRLDESFGGKTVPLRNRQFVFNHTSVDHTKYDSLRRAVYLPIIRNNLYSLFEQFDFPDPTVPTGLRHRTTIAPQALLLLNDDLIVEQSFAFARRVLRQEQNRDQRVTSIFQSVLCRPPTKTELQQAKRFLHDIAQNDEESAWSALCQSLLASNEFLYIR